jgi:hypothetical protein
MRTNYFLKHVVEGYVEGKMGMKEKFKRSPKQLLAGLKERRKVLEIERRSTRSHTVVNLLWKTLWIFW